MNQLIEVIVMRSNFDDVENGIIEGNRVVEIFSDSRSRNGTKFATALREEGAVVVAK